MTDRVRHQLLESHNEKQTQSCIYDDEHFYCVIQFGRTQGYFWKLLSLGVDWMEQLHGFLLWWYSMLIAILCSGFQCSLQVFSHEETGLKNWRELDSPVVNLSHAQKISLKNLIANKAACKSRGWIHPRHTEQTATDKVEHSLLNLIDCSTLIISGVVGRHKIYWTTNMY